MKTVKHYRPIPRPENDRTAGVAHDLLTESLTALAGLADQPRKDAARREQAMRERERAVGPLTVLHLAGAITTGQFTLTLCHIDALMLVAIGDYRAPAPRQKRVEYVVLLLDEHGDSHNSTFHDTLKDARADARRYVGEEEGDGTVIVGTVIERVRLDDPLDRTTIETHGQVTPGWIDAQHP